MIKFALIPLLTVIVMMTHTLAYSQQYKLKADPATLDNPANLLVAVPGGSDYITFSGELADGKNKKTTIIARYDGKFKKVYSNQLPGLDGKAIRDARYVGDKLMLYWTTDDNEVGLSAIDDARGVAEGAPTILYQRQQEVYSGHFSRGNADNGNFQYAFSTSYNRKDDGKTFDGTILDGSGKLLKKFTYSTPEEKYSVSFFNSIQANDGTLFIIYGAAVKKSNRDDYRPFEYALLQVNTDGKITSRSLAALPTGNIQDLTFKMADAKLVFTGLLSPDKKSGYTMFLTGSYEIATGKLMVKQTDLTTLGTVQQLGDTYLKDVSKKGLPNEIAYDTTIAFKDGSAAFIYKTSNRVNSQSYFAVTSHNGMSPGTPSYSVSFQTRGDIYVVKVNAAGVPQWVKVIPLDQEEPDANLAIGTICTTDEKDILHVFFFDNSDNSDAEAGKHHPKKVNTGGKKSTSLCSVRLTPAGTTTKQFIELADPDSDFRISPERSAGLRKNEVAFISFKRKGMNFNVNQIYNNAGYHFGIIAIK